MTNQRPLAVVILAAGKGTRMNSKMPKVMHTLLGLPMINWLLSCVEKLSPAHVVVVVGKGMQDLVTAVQPHKTVIQDTQDGTGSALKSGMSVLQDFDGDILVLLGDTPLISLATMRGLIAARHQDDITGISVLGVRLDNPAGYGRLLLDDGYLKAIREDKDASPEERCIDIVNTGAFCLDAGRVDAWLDALENNNAQGEFYITDLPEIAAREGIKTRVSLAINSAEVLGCNTRIDLSNLEQTAQQKMREDFMTSGVVMQDPSSVYLHHDTKIASGAIIEPNVYFGANVEVGKNVHIKAFCHFDGAIIGDNSIVGPFARLRPGSDIGEEVRIGNFVEIKKSKIGDRSKISHLGYVGDCTMGEDVNFSCGAITVNYDGFDKYQTVIGKGVMVGSNVNLVAPLTLDDGAFIAAGSTITTDVPADALSMERSKAEVRSGWAALYRKRKEKAHELVRKRKSEK
ncbi:MAG: bifunctional N-acetylglucosamine-1-phosphate uridyltransferase/glucosamine-1-phosphate acetyltransferase [Zetaproteobacteria bacterium]|nr:MAG: bifunctional N-acetylglucosamine-1-phosphate uridyltransferase/glucosamine-1-phosphate acetyltransferase [Zetaproteobacteria bacterium]